MLALQLHFGPLQLISRDALQLKFAQFVDDDLHAFVGLLGSGTGVQAHSAAVLAASRCCPDVIDQPPLLAHLHEEARGHIATQHFADHHRGIIIRIEIVGERKHYTNMFLLILFQLYGNIAGRMWDLLWERGGTPRPVAKKCLYPIDYVLPIKLTSNREEHVIGLIARLPELLQIRPLLRLYALTGSQDWTAQRGSTVEIRSHQLENAAHRFIVAATNLLQNDAAHLLQLAFRKSGQEQQFVNKVKRGIKLAVDNL